MFRLVVLSVSLVLVTSRTTYYSDPNASLPPSMRQTMLFYERNIFNMDHFKPIVEDDSVDNFLPNYRAGPVVSGHPVVDGARVVHSTRANLALQRHLEVNTAPIVPQVTSGQTQNSPQAIPYSPYSNYPVYYF